MLWTGCVGKFVGVKTTRGGGSHVGISARQFSSLDVECWFGGFQRRIGIGSKMHVPCDCGVSFQGDREDLFSRGDLFSRVGEFRIGWNGMGWDGMREFRHLCFWIL